MFDATLKLPVKQRLFLYAFIQTGDGKKSAIIAEYKNPSQAACNLLNRKKFPLLNEEIDRYMDILEAKSELTAEYMRKYLYDILDADWSEHFKPDGLNTWSIDAVDYDKVPHKIKRLVEDIQYKEVIIGIPPNQRREVKLYVRFVSKKDAMVTAAKHTLTQKLLIQGEASIDFDEIAKRVAEKRAARTIETKIEETKMLALPAPAPKLKEPSTNGSNGTASH